MMRVLLLTIALSGCVTYVRTLMLTDAVYTPTQQIEFLARDPSRPHVEIARLRVSRHNSDNPMRLEMKARQLGADAIVRFATLETGVSSGFVSGLTGAVVVVSDDEDIYTAIRYTDR